MKNILVSVLVSFLASSAFALNADVEKRFPIVTELVPSVKFLKLAPQIGKNVEMAKIYIEDMNWVKSTGWNEAMTDFCFNTAASTVETGGCASQQVRFVQGTVTALFNTYKARIRSNPFFRSYNFEIVAVKYLQNAAIAQGKIVEDLCDVDTIGWYGGTGRGAQILGCRSSFVSNTSDFDALGAIASYDGSAANLAEDSQEFSDVSEVAYVIEKQRRSIKKQVDEGDFAFDQEDLMTVDTQLMTAYEGAKKYYTDTYSDGDMGWALPEGTTLAKYALETLKKTEIAWIGYRDAYCQAYSILLFPNATEHSVYGPLTRVQCLSNLTRKQIEVLNNLDH